MTHIHWFALYFHIIWSVAWFLATHTSINTHRLIWKCINFIILVILYNIVVYIVFKFHNKSQGFATITRQQKEKWADIIWATREESTRGKGIWKIILRIEAQHNSVIYGWGHVRNEKIYEQMKCILYATHTHNRSRENLRIWNFWCLSSWLDIRNIYGHGEYVNRKKQQNIYNICQQTTV